MKFISESKREFLEIIQKIRHKDFSGNKGIAIKNSIYNISTTAIAKIGGFLFSAIIARILMPELFGLYSLALSMVFTFVVFADLGIGSTLIRFVSGALAKGNDKKAKGYYDYLLKLKFLLVIVISLILIVSSKFIAVDYFNKPIFLALLIGSLSIIFISFVSFMESFFQSLNNFRFLLLKESLFQFLKIVIPTGLILLFLKLSASQEINIFLITIFVTVPYVLTLFLLIFFAKRKISFLNLPKTSINSQDKKRIIRFILPLSLFALATSLFGYMDMILLGKFVTAEFIGYYSAALVLLSFPAAFSGFSTVLFPIFSRLTGKRLEAGLKRSVRTILAISIVLSILLILFAPIIVNIVYGSDYQIAAIFLRIFSLLIISSQMTGLYTNYLISKGETKILPKILISVSAIKLAIDLSLIFFFLMSQPPLTITMGIAIVRIFSEYLYLGVLVIYSRRSR